MSACPTHLAHACVRCKSHECTCRGHATDARWDLIHCIKCVYCNARTPHAHIYMLEDEWSSTPEEEHTYRPRGPRVPLQAHVGFYKACACIIRSCRLSQLHSSRSCHFRTCTICTMRIHPAFSNFSQTVRELGRQAVVRDIVRAQLRAVESILPSWQGRTTRGGDYDASHTLRSALLFAKPRISSDIHCVGVQWSDGVCRVAILRAAQCRTSCGALACSYGRARARSRGA